MRVVGIIGVLFGVLLCGPCAAEQVSSQGKAIHALPSLKAYPVLRLDGSVIDASLSVPASRKSATVLVLQGSNCVSERDSLSSLVEPWRNRYAFLYIEKPGLSSTSDRCSAEYLAQNTIDQRMWDILRVVQKLRSEPWWNHKLYVIGGSEGGLMAGLTAANIPETRRVAILSFGGGLTMGEWWPKIAAAGVKKETGSEAAAAAEQADAVETFQRARMSPSHAEIYDGDGNTLAWWASIIDIRLQNTLLDLSIPILIVHGEADEFAPIEGARLVADAFQKQGKRNLAFRELPKLNHSFADANGHSFLEGTYTSSLEWLLDHRQD